MKNCKSYHGLQSIRNLLFASLMVLATESSILAEDFPIEASVKSAKALIHSGPANVHYATDRLAKGTMVKVYRLDPDGWCAIRPPKRSFSIVPAELVKQSSADLGTIVEDKVPAWVGTLLGSVSDPMWQVQLKKDEEVEILGLIDSRGGSNQGSEKQGWFQIRPPAGEFRWIHIDNLADFDQRQIRIAAGVEAPRRQRNAKRSSISKSEATKNHSRQRKNIPTQPIPAEHFSGQNAAADYANEIKEGSFDNNPQYPVTTANFQDNGGWRPVRQPIRSFKNDSLANRYDSSSVAMGTTTSIPMTPLGSGSDSVQDVNDNSINSSHWNANDSLNSQPPITGSSLQDLDVALSNEMLKQPKQWNLEPLRQQVQQALANPDASIDRFAFDRLRSKIERCLAIQRSYQATNNANRRTAGGNSRIARESSGEARVDSRVADRFAGIYDAHGTLQELVRDGGLGQSTYVLQNERGQITHQIQPAPGVNLHRFLKKKIGVIGQRGFNQQSGLDHVTAQRIVDLNTMRR